MLLDALSCHLSLIFKHSGTKWEKKTKTELLKKKIGGGGGCAPSGSVAAPVSIWHVESSITDIVKQSFSTQYSLVKLSIVKLMYMVRTIWTIKGEVFPNNNVDWVSRKQFYKLQSSSFINACKFRDIHEINETFEKSNFLIGLCKFDQTFAVRFLKSFSIHPICINAWGSFSFKKNGNDQTMVTTFRITYDIY